MVANAVVQGKTKRQKFEDRVSKTFGMTPDEIRHQRRIDYGTGQHRQRPRRQRDINPYQAVVDLTPREMQVIDDLFTALDKSVERENAYPFDGAAEPLFAEGEQVLIELDGTRYTVRLGAPYLAFVAIGEKRANDRWRYRMHFDDLPTAPSLAVTQAQLVRIHVKPIITFAATHLLPAGDAVEALPLASAVFTTRPKFLRAKARLAANWNRQQPKYERVGHPASPLLGSLTFRQ